MDSATYPLRKYTPLLLPAQGRHLLEKTFAVSTLPRAAGEPPRAYFFRGLTDAYPPAGVSVYFLRWFK